MGRPQLALGTYAAIRCYKTDAGYRACTKARDYDGKTRSIERWAKSKAAAGRSLKLALRDRSRTQANGDVTAETRVSTLAEVWYAGLKDLSPSPCGPTATDSTGRSCPASASCGCESSASASSTGTSG